jgi:hypothetical protein
MQIPDYYKKPQVCLGDVPTGTYVYDDEANLCYVGEDNTLHSYGIVSGRHGDTIVYPITLETERIMKKMQELREKYNNDNIMNSQFNHELCEALHNIMNNDIQKERETWNALYERYRELHGHAVALGICK